MKKKFFLKEIGKITAYSPTNFFEEQLVNSRNNQLRRILEVQTCRRHSMEEVGNFGGVLFFDDTSSDNINSICYSMEKVNRPLIWISGGNDENVNYSEILQTVVEKVKMLICIGEDNSNLLRTFSAYMDVYECKSMEHAVKTAYYAADKEDLVILSMACECDSLYRDKDELRFLYKKAVSEL